MLVLGGTWPTQHDPSTDGWYKAIVTDAEAASVGVTDITINTWGERIRPLLIAKGIPADKCQIGARYSASRKDGVSEFRFPR